MAKSKKAYVRTRCKYCLAPLTEDGYCSRPCRLGELRRKLGEPQDPPTQTQNKS